MPLPDVASMLNGVLVLRNQVMIDRLSDSCDANFVHIYCTASGIFKIMDAKVQKFFDVCNDLCLFL